MLCATVKNKKYLSDKILLKGTFSFQRLGLTDFSEIFAQVNKWFTRVNRIDRELKKVMVTELVAEINPSISSNL